MSEENVGTVQTIKAHVSLNMRNSPEWNLPRCSSDAFMTLKLKSKPLAPSKSGGNKS